MRWGLKLLGINVDFLKIETSHKQFSAIAFNAAA